MTDTYEVQTHSETSDARAVPRPRRSLSQMVRAGWGLLALLPLWAQAVLIYATSRVFVAFVVVRTSAKQADGQFGGAQPAYGEYLTYWDGYWYRRIAEYGYRNPVPLNAQGQAEQSEWAFFPAYPVLVRALREVTGLPVAMIGPALSLLLGAVAIVVLLKLFQTRASDRTALVAVSLVCTYPASPVLQATYTESLAMLALASATFLLVRQRYLLACIPAVLLGFTRPVGLPLALVVLVHLICRIRERKTSPIRLLPAASLVLLGLVTAVSSVLWPLYVGWLSGRPKMYTEIQATWHGGHLAMVSPWRNLAVLLFGDVGGWLVLLSVFGLLVWSVLRPRGRALLGPEMAAWSLAYAGYLLVVLQPGTSLFRYLLLLYPMALLIAGAVRDRAHLVTWIFFQSALLVVWFSWLWHARPPSDIPP